jgi:macrolide-specific efflux system membrane fusion protein
MKGLVIKGLFHQRFLQRADNDPRADRKERVSLNKCLDTIVGRRQTYRIFMKLKGKRKRGYLILAVVVVLAGGWLWRTLNAPLPSYQTLIVRQGDLQQSVLATGKLDAVRKVDVGAQVSGQLKTLSVAIGDKVKKDQLLGIIDPEQAQNQIKEVDATLMELRAQRLQALAERKLAQVTYARNQQLAQKQLISRQDLDTTATDVAVKNAQIGTIDAQIQRNQATLDTAKTNLDYTRIVAPMAGEVTQITTLQGQTVIAAQQAPNILTLADLSTMLVKAQVSEADVIHLKPGQKAWFTVLGDPLTRYEGTLKDILPTPEKVNDAIFYYARFEVPNPQGVLRLEMTAQVHIQLSGVTNVLSIPLSALGDATGDNRYNVRLLRNGEVKEREITIGSRNDTDVEVVKGLEEGDEVITGEGKPGAIK